MNGFLKKCASLALSAAMVFSLISCGGGDAANEENIVWGVKSETNLFGLLNTATGEYEGFDIDIAKEISKRIGKEPLFKEVTSKTRIPMLNQNDINAIIATMTITEERTKEVDFSEVYFEAGQTLLVKEDSDITGVDDLAGKTVIVAKGSTTPENIKKATNGQAKLNEMENYAECFAALKAGQGDAFSTDDTILMGFMANDPGKFKLVGGKFTSEPYGIAVKKGNDELRGKINKALEEMKADGTYQKIYDHWFAGLIGNSGEAASFLS